jgi:hypothetical protein
MKMWCAVLAAALVLSGCTGKQTPLPQSSSAAAQEEVVPAGFYRKPKDGEICKKLDPAPLKALLPGIEPGPAMGIYQGYLKCEFTRNTPSLVNVDMRVWMYPSAEQAAKERETTVNLTATAVRTLTLPLSQAQASADDDRLTVIDQNMVLAGGVSAVDKALVTPQLVEVVHQLADNLVVLLRKEFQATTGPSPTAQPRQVRVVSPPAVHGRTPQYEQQYDEVRFILREDLDRLDASDAVASAYGTTKANNVLIFAATLAVLKTEAQIDAALTRLAREGITLTRPVSDKLDEWTEIRCGDGRIKQFTGALCLWRDKDSIGVAAFPGQKPAEVKADFLTLRKLATEG